MKIMMLFMMAAAEIPELLPMREEIPPTFIEKHGWWPVIGLAAGVIAVAVAAILLLRRKKAVEIIPADAIARSALEALRGRTEDTVLVEEVSGIVRRYLMAVFVPAQDELTTDELVRLLQNDARVRSETRTALAEFLKYCDVRKFAPEPGPMKPGLVEQALELVRGFEADRRVASPATVVRPA
jgi:hypothetical protein